MSRTIDLGKGRFEQTIIQARFTARPKGFRKMTCSECGREYYIRTGDNRKVFKTCSASCSMNRQSRLQKKNLALRRSEKKFVGIYFTKAEYDVIKRFAKATPVSRFMRSIINTDMDKRTARAGTVR